MASTMEGLEVKHEPELGDVVANVPDVKPAESEDSSENMKEDAEAKKAELDKIVYYHEQFHMREVVIHLPGGSQMRFNPLASLFGISVLWGLAIWCMTDPDGASSTLVEWRGRIAELFTWFYVGTNPAFMVFIIYMAFRFGDVKLGPKDSEPEFDDITYFAMLFSAGIGVGLFFYGVSEPLWHQSSHWFSAGGYRSEDEVDMFAINLTVFHWGVTGWSQYLVVALCAGLAGFRYNLPFTVRSCFYPIIGEYTWGWLGDILDGFTIVTTVAGVCTSLGLGAFQLAAGLKVVGAIEDDLTEDEMIKVYVLSIWVITLTATCSVISGLDVGIKILSQLGMGLGLLLLFLVFIMEKTNYILNLIVQETGYYFQWSIFLLNFHTDTFGQLREGEGRASDDKSAATWWMDSWTIFYIGWWVAWAAFVGLFIARISRGRTIRSVVVNSYLAPFVYTVVWFGVFGGSGIRQARQANEMEALGLAAFNNTEEYLSPGSTYCYDVPQEDVVVDGTTMFTNYLEGVTPVCKFNSGEADMAWFNVLKSFSYPNDFDTGFGPFLCWLSIFALAIYFITSSDSGSLIVDNLASNGFEQTHWLQRVFWAFTEGALATALLVAGGNNALRALQAASILSGLPFTLFLIFMCLSIHRMCTLAEQSDKDGVEVSLQEDFKKHKIFTTPIYGGVFNIFEVICSLGNVHPARAEAMPAPTSSSITKFLIATFVPFVPLNQIYNQFSPKASSKTGNTVATAVYAVCFISWVLLFILMGPVGHGLRAFAWSFFLFNACILSTLRNNFRARYNIEGNLIADYLVSAFFWPQALIQMQEELELAVEKGEMDV